jgi:hypothetical protein
MIEMLKRGGNDWRALALFGFFCVPTPIGEIMGIAALLWGLWQACSRHAECSETLPQ